VDRALVHVGDICSMVMPKGVCRATSSSSPSSSSSSSSSSAKHLIDVI